MLRRRCEGLVWIISVECKGQIRSVFPKDLVQCLFDRFNIERFFLDSIMPPRKPKEHGRVKGGCGHSKDLC